KGADSDQDSAWAISYGDMMSLLLVIFVMIAAMSELKVNPRFERVSGAVRSAFGFAQPAGLPDLGPTRTETLLERLGRMGQRPAGTLAAAAAALSPCDF